MKEKRKPKECPCCRSEISKKNPETRPYIECGRMRCEVCDMGADTSCGPCETGEI